MKLNFPPLPETPCPKNGFGKGDDYTPADDERVELLQKWDAWESEHPDDPTGDLYLEKYRLQNANVKPQRQQKAVVEDNEVTQEMMHQLPVEPTPLEQLLMKRRPGRPKVIAGEITNLRLVLTVELYEAFVGKCASQGVTMSRAARELIQAFVNS